MPYFETVTPPAIEPVTLAEAKEHAIIDASLGTDDDVLISNLIVAATAHVELLTRRALITRTDRIVFDDWRQIWNCSPNGGYAEINRGPFQSATSISTIDESDVKTDVDAATWYSNKGELGHGVVAMKGGLPFPVAGRSVGGLEIQFKRGYGDAAADVPESLRRAIMMLVAHWYEHREAVAVDKDARPAISAGVPRGFDEIVASYRKLRVM